MLRATPIEMVDKIKFLTAVDVTVCYYQSLLKKSHQVRNCCRHDHQDVHVGRPVLDGLVGGDVEVPAANELKQTMENSIKDVKSIF